MSIVSLLITTTVQPQIFDHDSKCVHDNPGIFFAITNSQVHQCKLAELMNKKMNKDNVEERQK